MSRVHVGKLSAFSIVITVVLSILCVSIFLYGRAQLTVLDETTDAYITCESDARQLQNASDYLTEQVRLAATSGDESYIKSYFNEADNVKRRESALAELKKYFGDSSAFGSLQEALNSSNNLMETEEYAMLLVCEANRTNATTWPEEIKNVQLSSEDALLAPQQKRDKAQQLVFDQNYENAKSDISSRVVQCTDELIQETKNSQGHASTVFNDVYLKIEISVALFALISLALCLFVRVAMVKPLVQYGESIKKNKKFPVVGAAELQNLAETYNEMYENNEAAQALIKHQAEHDALTDLLNRGSYDKLLKIYDQPGNHFALIMVDVDVFKSVNDTYGHEVGDKILKRVAKLLQTAFRSIDHVCRIGGDEFAIIMVDMTPDLAYTIEEKIDAVNKLLSEPEEGCPVVSLSVGVAFSDRKNPSDSIFKDADKALYKTKETGRNGCSFY